MLSTQSLVCLDTPKVPAGVFHSNPRVKGRDMICEIDKNLPAPTTRLIKKLMTTSAVKSISSGKSGSKWYITSESKAGKAKVTEETTKHSILLCSLWSQMVEIVVRTTITYKTHKMEVGVDDLKRKWDKIWQDYGIEDYVARSKWTATHKKDLAGLRAVLAGLSSRELQELANSYAS